MQKGQCPIYKGTLQTFDCISRKKIFCLNILKSAWISLKCSIKLCTVWPHHSCCSWIKRGTWISLKCGIKLCTVWPYHSCSSWIKRGTWISLKCGVKLCTVWPYHSCCSWIKRGFCGLMRICLTTLISQRFFKGTVVSRAYYLCMEGHLKSCL